MKQFNILTVSMAIFAIAAVTTAQEQSQQQKLGVTLDATYVTRYMVRGFDTYPNNHSAFQPSIDLDLYGTGFGINIWSSMANGSGFEDCKEMDYTVYYCNSLFKDEPWQTNYELGWIYYAYHNLPRKAADIQEIYASFSLPKILSLGIVPSYTAVCTWPAVSDSDVSNIGGWFHIFGLGYDLCLPPLLPDAEKQIVHLSAETIYNDGAYAPCREEYGNVDHDWSHAVFGISVPLCLSKNLTFTPSWYYQSSWENSVNENDEQWTGLSLTYKF